MKNTVVVAIIAFVFGALISGFVTYKNTKCTSSSITFGVKDKNNQTKPLLSITEEGQDK